MLATAPYTAYIHEPFNIYPGTKYPTIPFDYWFQYVCEENAAPYAPILKDILHCRYHLGVGLSTARTWRQFVKAIRDFGLDVVHRAKGDTPVVKDPIAIFSAGWLAETFDLNVLVMIRHPAAFCASLKVKNWRFDFANWLNQPLLIRDRLSGFEEEIREYTEREHDLIDQAILLWNCIHGAIAAYRENYPHWLFVRHEDLSREPVAGFRSICETFELEFTSRTESAILDSSGAHNPTEQGVGRNLKRNSRENIKNWKSRLTREEIERIKKKTKNVSDLFYSGDEW